MLNLSSDYSSLRERESGRESERETERDRETE